MAASTARHETRALLRAHLAAFSGYRHLTRQCPVCHRLLRLAMEPTEPTDSAERAEVVETAQRRDAAGEPEPEKTAEPAEMADGDDRDRPIGM